MKTLMKSIVGIVGSVVLSGNLLATMLAYDGVPLGTGAYAAGADLKDKSTSDARIVGFSGNWLNKNTGVAKVLGLGLEFPMVFVGVEPVGGSCGLNTGGTVPSPAANGRLQYRALAANLLPTAEGTFYFRALMRSQSGAAATMPAGTYRGIGLSQAIPSSTNKGADDGTANGSGYNLTTDGLWFGFKKDASGAGMALVLHLKGCPDYVLVSGVQADVTYLCVAEVSVGTGADGAEHVRAFAVPASEYFGGTPYAVSVGVDGTAETELMASGVKLSYLCFGGVYYTNDKNVCFDEIAIATDLVDVLPADAALPALGDVALTRGVDGTFRVSAELMSGSGDVYAVATDVQGNEVTNVLGTAVVAGLPMSVVLQRLAEDTSYQVKAVAVQGDFAGELSAGMIYTGDLMLSLENDATELDFVPGRVRVSRADAGVALPVSFAVTGLTAVPDVDYVEPAETVVTIPEGETSAVISVTPLYNTAVDADTAFEVSLTAGLYGIGGDPVEVTIMNYDLPEGYNVWVARTAGNASDPANWSYGRVPQTGDRILLGTFSTADMTWNGGVNGLTDTVAEWLQRVEYTGTVTFATTYEAHDATFTNLTVTGNVTIDNGVWTHPANDAVQSYRLSVSVGGNFALAAAAKIDAKLKGYAVGKYPAGGALGVHGGSRSNFAQVYGDVYAPADIGAGGRNYAGGGAVWLDIVGTCVLDGSINANTQQNSSIYTDNASGAGGSIFVRAAAVSGTGTLLANGAMSGGDGGVALRGTPAGSGGRIAVICREVNELTLPLTNIQAYGDTGGIAQGAAAGTVYIKTANQPHGTLLVDSKATNYTSFYTFLPSVYGTTCVKPGETWTFDSIITRGFGVLSVPPNATLVLPNGFASVTSTDTSVNDGIIYLGGVIVVPEVDEHVFRSNWVFQAHVPYTFNSDVRVTEQGALGCIARNYSLTNALICDLTVNGNLTVDSGSRITAEGAGTDWDEYWLYNSVHGGQSGFLTTNVGSCVYGSVFNPLRPGTPGSNPLLNRNNRRPGSGAIRLTVNGRLHVDGSITAEAKDRDYEWLPGGGGSLNITARTLTGTGKIDVSGSTLDKANEHEVSGGPGRIAIRLTDPEATFDAFGESRIQAKSIVTRTTIAVDRFASAGTIYLQTAADGECGGRIIVRNNNDAKDLYSYTPLPSTQLDGENDVYDNAALEIGAGARVQLWASLRMRALKIESGSVLDLHGQRLMVKSAEVGGVKLAIGRYAGGSLGDQLLDSGGGGELQVTGFGTIFMLR